MNMKRIIIGAVIVAAVLLVYFICGSSGPDGDESRNTSPLLVDSSGGEDSGSGIRDGSDSAGGGAAEDAAPEAVAADTASFFLSRDRTGYQLRSAGSFRKLSATTEMTGYVGSFAASSDVISAGDPSKLSNVISILLPTDVGPGTYTEKSPNFMVQFFGKEPGTLFNLNHACSFSLTVDEWGGPGGRVRGSFSGEMRADGSGTIISITDGRFEAGIQQ